MVDENLPPGEEMRPSAPEPAAATVAATAERAATLAAEREAGAPPDASAVAKEPGVESERERWLRERFEREHEVLLALTRLIIAGLGTESRAMRFWRWLIDDMRSERRMLGTRGEERMLIRRVLAWFRERRFDRSSRIPAQYGEPSGSASRGELPPP
jgi:hypothetical protein